MVVCKETRGFDGEKVVLWVVAPFGLNQGSVCVCLCESVRARERKRCIYILMIVLFLMNKC